AQELIEAPVGDRVLPEGRSVGLEQRDEGVGVAGAGGLDRFGLGLRGKVDGLLGAVGVDVVQDGLEGGRVGHRDLLVVCLAAVRRSVGTRGVPRSRISTARGTPGVSLGGARSFLARSQGRRYTTSTTRGNSWRSVGVSRSSHPDGD